ncbi:MAG: helix-turn-helix transcriptional regulator [Solobacterium sp.]|nr:helix-turn-helix transcriptional regulator [Solobacterium sp.]
MSVGQNLRTKRREKKLTVKALADKIGADHSTIVRYENGDVRRIPEEQLNKLAAALDCSVDELTEGDFKYTSMKKVSSKSFTEEEKTLILKYRQLPIFVQNTIKEMCDWPFNVN